MLREVFASSYQRKKPRGCNPWAWRAECVRLRLQLDLVLEVDVEPLHLLVERGAVDPERAGRFLTVPAVRLKGLEDQLAFRMNESRLEGAAAESAAERDVLAGFDPHVFGEVGGGDQLVLREHDRPLDD